MASLKIPFLLRPAAKPRMLRYYLANFKKLEPMFFIGKTPIFLTKNQEIGRLYAKG
jgi:hypothetical protein